MGLSTAVSVMSVVQSERHFSSAEYKYRHGLKTNVFFYHLAYSDDDPDVGRGHCVLEEGQRGKAETHTDITWYSIVSESESERYLFDPHKKLIQSNNEKQLGSGDPY